MQTTGRDRYENARRLLALRQQTPKLTFTDLSMRSRQDGEGPKVAAAFLSDVARGKQPPVKKPTAPPANPKGRKEGPHRYLRTVTVLCNWIDKYELDEIKELGPAERVLKFVGEVDVAPTNLKCMVECLEACTAFFEYAEETNDEVKKAADITRLMRDDVSILGIGTKAQKSNLGPAGVKVWLREQAAKEKEARERAKKPPSNPPKLLISQPQKTLAARALIG